ncbi:MAG: o-succinylbenzoate synthase, partial [Actinobacteria bacterium]|nr:o-succinylbenzoate synthase [Actinomycetota bacterium]
MKIDAFELIRLALPLVAPFRTSFGTQHDRDVLLVRVRTPETDGWGECVALSAPVYSAEYIDGAQHVIEAFLAPRLLDLSDVSAQDVGPALAAIQGHRMAK